MRAHVLPLFAAVLVLAAAAPARAAPFEVAPVPAWAVPAPALPAEAPPDGVAEMQVVDRQLRVDGPAPELFVRRSWKILSRAGLERFAQVEVSFEPSYQKLALHELWIERDGKRRNVLDPAKVKIIQKESGLEEQLYDGALTALVFLEDARVGDTVGVSYSLTGDNPVFAGHLARALEVSGGVAVRAWRFRLVGPRDLFVTSRAHHVALDSTVRDVGAAREWVWQAADVKPPPDEDGVPVDEDPNAWLEVSDFHDWAEVVRWARPLFPDAAASPELDAEVARLRAAGDAKAQTLAALRFVQDEVRYLGIELGPNSHEPHPPGQVLTQRFGDCKDKAYLLVTLLRRLGLDADVALVNTEIRRGLDGMLPGPNDFDHAIVRTRLGGKTYWLDATRSLEGGALDDLVAPRFDRALVLDPATTGLETIPRWKPSGPLERVEETYAESPARGDVALTVVTRYAGPRADEMRRTLGETTLEALGKRYLDFYRAEDLELKSTGPLQVKDDRAAGTLTVTERYDVSHFWDAAGHHTFDGAPIREALRVPRVRERRAGFELGPPQWVRYEVRLERALHGEASASQTHQEGPHLTFAHDYDSTDRLFKLDMELHTDDAVLRPDELGKYLSTVEGIKDRLGFETWRGSVTPVARESEAGSNGLSPVLILLATAAVVLGVIWLAGGGAGRSWRALRNRHRKASFSSKVAASAGRGESAAEPIALVQGMAPEAALARLKCRCGGALAPDPAQPTDALRYDGRVVLAVAARCEGCGNGRRVYVAPPPEQAA